tara:strand:+ start:74 stop:223 length:150 start_codon:yes stop_codon:yes gene_type:complete
MYKYKYKCCKHHHNIEYKERQQFERKLRQAEDAQVRLELDEIQERREAN